jgi:hypothetical protein
MSELPAAMEWTAWPLRRSLGRGAFAAAFVGATIAVVAQISGPLLAVVAALVLAFSLAPFFVPTHYRLDAEGVAVRRLQRTTRRPWSAFRSVRSGPTMCLLSPGEKRSWLDAYRGCSLLLEGNRAEVVRYAEAMVGSARAGASGERG